MPANLNNAAASGWRGAAAWIGRYLRDERAAVSPILVLSLVPIIGALGMGVESSNWWLTQRAVQNAADTAALAADWNGGQTAAGSLSGSGFNIAYSTSGCNNNPGYYDCEGVGAAAKAGYVNGSNNVTVYPQWLASGPCPGTLTNCYKVTVVKKLPIYLLGVVGFSGNSTLASGAAGQVVEGVAYAGLTSKPVPDCILSLATSGTGVRTNGAPKVDLGGCDIQSNSSDSKSGTCNGSNLNATFFASPGTDNGCGINAINGAATVSDPFDALKSSIPKDPCGGTPSNYPLNTVGSTMTGTTYAGQPHTIYYCGTAQLSANVTINSTTTVIIYNGQLDLNGFTLKSGSSAGVTFIFAGTNTVSGGGTTITPYHNFADNSSSGKGVLDIAAPTNDPSAPTYDATWHGVTIYESPVEVTGSGPTSTPLVDQPVTNKLNSLDIMQAGSAPSLDLTGLLYAPNADFQMSGAIDQSSNGFKCFLLVTKTLLLNGNGSIFKNNQSECNKAGTTQVFTNITVHTLAG